MQIHRLKVVRSSQQRRWGPGRQEARRHLERAVRREVVALRRCARSAGWTAKQFAERLRLARGTPAQWERRWRQDHLAVRLRGRRVERTDRQTRTQLIAVFGLMGPAVGIPALQSLFPSVPRRELEDLAHRYRLVYRRRNRALIYALRWMRPGTVWSMDFTDPLEPIDGLYPCLFVVRDLASGFHPLVLPAPQATAEVVCHALEVLFRNFGPPLVMKDDNDRAFLADETGQLLDTWGILQLLSPCGTPEYNGSCEAGIGGLKVRAHYESARHDRPGLWSCDDLEAARCIGNLQTRLWGKRRPSPQEAWESRYPISEAYRASFHDTVKRYRDEVRQEQGYPLAVEPGRVARASIDRIAISRALIDHGLLEFRRRRITDMKSLRKRSKIS